MEYDDAIMSAKRVLARAPNQEAAQKLFVSTPAKPWFGYLLDFFHLQYSYLNILVCPATLRMCQS